jgi:hypothetical protein
MTQAALDALKPKLMEMSAEELRKPRIPVRETVSEAKQTVEVCRQNPLVKSQLAKVGHDKAKIDAVEEAAQACDRAEVLCRHTLSGVKSAEALATVREAEALEQEILGAFRFNMRDDRDVQAKVRRIAEGSGLLDTKTDIALCAELLRAHPNAFDADETFDAAEALATCEEIEPKLDALLTDPADVLAREAALDLRDRAWTHLDTLLDDLRFAGQHALRKHPTERRHFTSAYNRAAKRRAADAQT